MSEQVIRQVGKTRNVVGYTLWWLKFINYHLLSKNGVVVSRSHSCYWPFQPLGLLVWTLRLGLVMKQIQQEQGQLKYNQTIPWDKTQTEVGIHYHECQRKLKNCKILLQFRNKRTIKKDVTVTLYHTTVANTARKNSGNCLQTFLFVPSSIWCYWSITLGCAHSFLKLNCTPGLGI